MWVVAGLLAAFGVAAGGLQMAVGDGADPDALPGGRDDEGLDAGEGFLSVGLRARRGLLSGVR